MTKEQLTDLFSDMIKKIEKRIRLHAFIIFGSRAKGNYLDHSDYDVLIIADFTKKYLDRNDWVVHQTTPMVAIDVFCYTLEEFDALFNNYRLTAIDAIDEGIVLKGEDYIKKYKEKLKDFKKRGMKKEDNILHPPQN